MNLRYTGGTTNTAAAIRLIRSNMFQPENGDDPDAINVAIIITDGEWVTWSIYLSWLSTKQVNSVPNLNLAGKSNVRDQTLAEAVAARKAGIHIVAIGVGPSIEVTELNGMASDPDSSNVYVVKDFYALTRIMVDLLNGICNSKYDWFINFSLTLFIARCRVI